MIILMLVLSLLLLAGIWVFANYLPKSSKPKAVQRYNRLLVVFTLISPLGLSGYLWYASRHGELTASWPVLAVLSSLLLIAVILLLGSALRMMLFDEED